MSLADNLKKEYGIKTNNTPSLAQRLRQEAEKESLASNKGMTAEQFDRSKFADAENTRKAQMQKELNSVPEPTNLESFNKKASETKWYAPKVGLVKDFLKLDTSDKQKVAQKATEDMTKSDVYAFSDAFADSATLGLRPVLQKKLFGNIPNGEDYLQKKKETKDNNKAANTLGTIAGYIAPGAAVEKVAAKALAPTLTKVGSKIGQKAIFGAATGGGMELAEGLIRGDSPEDLANRTATGAAFGGIGDAAVYGIGKGAGKIFDKLKAGKTLTKAEAEIAQKALEAVPETKINSELGSLKADDVIPDTTLSNPIVAEKIPTSVTTSYKPETSLKTDLTKPSEVIPDGEIKERGFSENIRTDANRPDAERAIFDKDPEFYNVLNNKTTLGKAQERFAQGYENALKDFDATKGTLRADNVPLAKLIADEAVKRGDVATARRVLVDVSESLTTAGQYSQAAKILRESNDPSAVIDYLNREINTLNAQGTKRYGKNWKNIDLTPEELNKLKEMPTDMTDEQKTKLFEEIGDSIASRIPTTAREKFDAVRRMAMLFNPKTHIRNVAGNSMMAGLSKISDTVAATMEKGLNPELRTKSFIAKKEFKDIAETYWQTNKKNLTEGGRWELFGVKSPFGEKATFKTKWLETLNDVSKKTLEGEDVMFMKKHFTDSLAGFMQARSLKEPTEEAVEYATRRAQEATFREANELANSINKLKGTKGGLIVEAAIPFTKTPANILTTGARYSPIGLVNSAVQLINKENPAKVIETFSKGLTGSGLTMMGFYMAKNGLARGQYENSSKVEGLKQASGELPNSIITPKGSYTIDWAQPASLPFFMGVGMAESIKKNGGDDYLEVAKDALIAGGDSLINQSMLKNIKDLFGGYGSTTEKVMQLPVNYLTQAFPTVAGQTTRIIDPLKRQTDYSSSMSKMLTGLQAKTPIASKELPLKRDILGQPQKYGEGVLNIVQQLISPGYIAKKSDDPIIKEINRLYDSEGSDFLPRATVYKFTKDKVDYKLTNSEVSEFQRIMGEYTKDNLTSLIQSPEYNSLSDADKAKKIKAINDDGYELAKQTVMKLREP